MSRNETSEPEYKPAFGHTLGIWYPLIWRILDLNRFCSSEMWFRPSALYNDLWLGFCWITEIIIILCFGYLLNLESNLLWIGVGFVAFRFIDLMFALFSILIRGFNRRPGKWYSVNRIIFLVTTNAVEIFLVFAILYKCFEFLTPAAGKVNLVGLNFFEMFYLSVVTATTLGYGSVYPDGWLSQTLSIIETCSVFLVIVVLIGSVAGSRPPPVISEYGEPISQ